MKLIQGQNDPLLFQISEDLLDADEFSAILIKDESILKEWDELETDEGLLSLSLDQEETIDFPSGRAILDMKFYKDEKVFFSDLINITICERYNKTIFGGD